MVQDKFTNQDISKLWPERIVGKGRLTHNYPNIKEVLRTRQV